VGGELLGRRLILVKDLDTMVTNSTLGAGSLRRSSLRCYKRILRRFEDLEDEARGG